MRTTEDVKSELVKQWLDKAADDVGLAEHLVSENTSFFTAVGFHAQQAAEKYLKAFLVHHQMEFPKTHDLAKLLDLVAPVDSDLAGSLRDITELSPYGVEFRYPGDYPTMTSEDAKKALSLVKLIRDAILGILQKEV